MEELDELDMMFPGHYIKDMGSNDGLSMCSFYVCGTRFFIETRKGELLYLGMNDNHVTLDDIKKFYAMKALW